MKITYENSLEFKMPQLAKEWHPTKNGELKPSEVTVGSGKKVWWYLPYDDPKTGKHFDFEWEAVVVGRTSGFGCPYISNPPKKIYKGFNDFETFCKENNRQYLLDEWHPTKNGNLKPSDIIARGGAHKVWWLKPYDDPKTGKHFDFEWKSHIYNRIKDVGCPFLSNPAKAAWHGFNDVETYCIQNNLQYILKEWHPIKNGELRPDNCVIGSEVKIWWLKPYDDPITGKHYDFEWETILNNRIAHGTGCPFLSNKALWLGFNDFETACIQKGKEYLLEEWDYEKNGSIKPNMLMAGSRRSIWWLKSYDDPITGKHFDFSWRSPLNARYRVGNGCPYLSGHKVWRGYNDFETFCKENNRQDLLDEWHPTKNGNLKPSDIIAGGGKHKIWWIKPYDDPVTGKHFDFEWKSSLSARVKIGIGCPFLTNASVWSGYNDFETYCLNNKLEGLLEEWDAEKNKIKPNMVTPFSNKKIWWKLPYDDPMTGKHFDFLWQAQVGSRISGTGCPFLSNKSLWSGYNDFETYCINNNLQNLLAEWHPKKNGVLKPSEILAGGGRMIWWYKPYKDPKTGNRFDFEWKTTIASRIMGSECPFLSNTKVWPGYNDLETYCHLNEMDYILDEWNYNKNRLTPDKTCSMSNARIWWIKSYDDPVTGKHFEFEWQAPLSTRVSSSRSQCPYLTNNPSLWRGFNDLETWCKLNKMEYLLDEWHPTKNRKTTPRDVTHASGIKRWWKCSKGHEWRNTPNHRCGGYGCPYCNKMDTN